MGEHAVLQGQHALVAAINRWITVTLKPRKDEFILISSKLGDLKTSIHGLKTLQIEKSFRFVLAAIKAYQAKLVFGFELIIESEFSDKIGFGSSAAVVVATVCVLEQLISENADKVFPDNWQKNIELFKIAKMIIQKVQGVGSGADVAASVMGGVVFYRVNPMYIEKLNISTSLTAVYSGYKTSTPEVIQWVEQRRTRFPKVYEGIFHAMQCCTLEAYAALKREDWKMVGDLLNVQHGLLGALGVSDPTLDHIAYKLRESPEMYGSKISGSGLGDCVIGLGTQSIEQIDDFLTIPLAISEEGLRLETKGEKGAKANLSSRRCEV